MRAVYYFILGSVIAVLLFAAGGAFAAPGFSAGDGTCFLTEQESFEYFRRQFPQILGDLVINAEQVQQVSGGAVIGTRDDRAKTKTGIPVRWTACIVPDGFRPQRGGVK